MTYKACSICGKEKEYSEFIAEKRNKSKVGSRCKKFMVPRLTYKDPRKIILRSARWRAKKKGIVFDIKPEDILIPKKCPVLDIDMVFNSETKGNSYSLDRLDPSKGYIKGNVQIISFKANAMKSNASFEEIEKLYFFMKKQEEKK